MITCLEQSQHQAVTDGLSREQLCAPVSCLCQSGTVQSPCACAVLTAAEVWSLSIEGQLLKCSVSLDRKPRIPMSTG